jgi:hypothetical protein
MIRQRNLKNSEWNQAIDLEEEQPSHEPPHTEMLYAYLSLLCALREPFIEALVGEEGFICELLQFLTFPSEKCHNKCYELLLKIMEQKKLATLLLLDEERVEKVVHKTMKFHYYNKFRY